MNAYEVIYVVNGDRHTETIDAGNIREALDGFGEALRSGCWDDPDEMIVSVNRL